MNPKVSAYFSKNTRWKAEIEALRTIVLSRGLDEELKWAGPCYSVEGRNVVLIHVFKNYCALLFFKGVLLKDTDGMLVQQTGNVQAARQIRFTGIKDIEKGKRAIKAYVKAAIEIEKSGLKVTLKRTEEFQVPAEFQNKLSELPKLNAAFKTLTPGRQRAYLLYFSQAKQATTREIRIEKYLPKILNGKGLND